MNARRFAGNSSATPREVLSRASISLPFKLLVLSIFLPDEVSFRAFGILLSPARLCLLALAPVALRRLSALVGTRRYCFVLSDLFVPLTGIWMFWSLAHTETLQDAVPHAGINVLEFSVAYMISRSLLRDGSQIIDFVNFLCICVGVVGLLGLLDTLTRHFFIHDLMTGLLGVPRVESAGFRLGFLRAASTIEHPILLGFACAIGVLLAFSVPIRAKVFAIFSCTLGLIIALSSAPIQAVVVGLLLLGYNKVLSGVRFRWAILIALGFAACSAIFLTVNNPLGYVFNHLVFDAESAYYRIYTWQISTAAVGASPWYGFGFVIPPEYGIPTTVDSVWLLKSLTFGIPGAVLIAASVVGSAWLPTNGRNVHLSAAESKLGTTLGIVIFLILFIGFTVDLFGNVSIMIPLLAGARARLGGLGRAPSSPRASMSLSRTAPLRLARFDGGARP